MHQAFLLSHWRWPVICAWTLVKWLLIQYSPKVNKSTPRLLCCFVGGASQLTHSMCKSFCSPKPFMLLIVLYKSVQYNYIIIMQWLVGSGIKAKWGLCQKKKVHGGLV